MERNPGTFASKARLLITVFLGVVCLYLIFFMPLPYFIFMPGTAEVIKPMVTVQTADPEERGSFMLTTVMVRDANIFGYLKAKVDPHEDIYSKSAIFKNGESETEYTNRQQVVMRSSQDSAIQAAYSKLGIPYRIQNDGVTVLRTLPGYPAEKVLAAGDTLTKVNDSPIHSSSDLLQALQGKKAGNTVVLSYKRKNEEKVANLALMALPPDTDEKGKPVAGSEARAGLGLVPADVQSVQTEKEGSKVTIKAGEIGGPSAGLMFTLEIYNQLSPGDLTKGYKIAGTGTIEPKGKVGSIGGIEHKIIAADKAGAEIFFAPKDETDPKSPDYTGAKNYSDAMKRATEIKSKMKIVPVSTLGDAIDYLAGLQAKP